MQLQAFEWIFLENGTWHCTVAKQITVFCLIYPVDDYLSMLRNCLTYARAK